MKTAAASLSLILLTSLFLAATIFAQQPTTGELQLGTISGRVLDANGRPAPSVSIKPLFYRTANDGTRTLTSLRGTLTNDRGEFRLFDLRPQSYFINYSNTILRNSGMSEPDLVSLETSDRSGSSQGLYPGVRAFEHAVSVEIRNGDEVHLKDIILTPIRYGSIRIRVTNPVGESAKDVQFGLNLSTPQISYSATGTTTSIGLSAPMGATFHLNPGATVEREYWPTQPGRHELTIGWKNAENKVESLVGQVEFDGASVVIDAITAKPERKLGVRVLMENADDTLQPVEGLYVVFGGSNASGLTYFVNSTQLRPRPGTTPRLLTGADGTADLPVAAGRYDITTLSFDSPPALPDRYLSSASQGNRDVLTEGVVVSDQDVFVEIRMRTGAATVTGNVRDSESRPIAGAEVALFPEGALNASKLISLRKTAISKSDGSFEMTAIKPGTYNLYAWKAFGNAYRDPAFMKKYEGKGTPVTILEKGRTSVTLQVLDGQP
jgi:hypothetical protein